MESAFVTRAGGWLNGARYNISRRNDLYSGDKWSSPLF